MLTSGTFHIGNWLLDILKSKMDNAKTVASQVIDQQENKQTYISYWGYQSQVELFLPNSPIVELKISLAFRNRCLQNNSPDVISSTVQKMDHNHLGTKE